MDETRPHLLPRTTELLPLWLRTLTGDVPGPAALVRPWLGGPTVPLAATPHTVAYTKDALRLLRYTPAVPRYATPILFVYSLINRYKILDFLPGRSLIEFLVEQGFVVYCIDWGTPTRADQDLTWDDYLHRYLDRCVQVVLAETGSPHLTLYGYCMGGTMALSYAALHPAPVGNFVAQAVPVDFANDGILTRWTERQFFNADALVDAEGNVPIALMESAFRYMDPIGTQQKWLDFFKKIGDPAFVETFLAMEEWAGDNIPFPGEVYRQYLRDCYQTNAFCRGEMQVGGRRVELRQITCPVLTVIADRDNIAPPASSEPLPRLVASPDTATLRFPTGHVGLTASSRARREYWPRVVAWLGPRSSPLPGATTPA